MKNLIPNIEESINIAIKLSEKILETHKTGCFCIITIADEDERIFIIVDSSRTAARISEHDLAYLRENYNISVIYRLKTRFEKIRESCKDKIIWSLL